MSARAKALFVLIIFGFLVSLYLTLKAHHPESVACSIGGACETVLSSRYAWLFGVSVAVWGLIWYAAGLILAYLAFFKRTYPWFYFLVWSVGGVVFSLYLLGLEAFKIHAYCTWCLSSLAAVVIIFLLTLTSRKELTND
ncbi:MAG TPA: vitamin K epoxide reductase family protein [Candidatus Saccharimonadales bacterium]|nr:vitamin K epoxide reductase family protein [Candidatus Saccharimonadales bacterium]